MPYAAAVERRVGTAYKSLTCSAACDKLLVGTKSELLAATFGAAEGILEVRAWRREDAFLSELVYNSGVIDFSDIDVLPVQITAYGTRNEREMKTRSKKSEVEILHFESDEGKCIVVSSSMIKTFSSYTLILTLYPVLFFLSSGNNKLPALNSS